jgi:hypothetical protein
MLTLGVEKGSHLFVLLFFNGIIPCVKFVMKKLLRRDW